MPNGPLPMEAPPCAWAAAGAKVRRVPQSYAGGSAWRCVTVQLEGRVPQSFAGLVPEGGPDSPR